MTTFAVAITGQSSRWWLYALTYAVLAFTAATLAFEMAQGVSRGLSRTRLWTAVSGAMLFGVIVLAEERAVRPPILASFVIGVLTCTLFFVGWLGLHRRR